MASGHGASEHVAAVGVVVLAGELDRAAAIAGDIADVGGEGTVAEELGGGPRNTGRAPGAGGEVGLEVDVQVIVFSTSECYFIFIVGGVRGPGVVGGVGGVDEFEGDGGGCVGGLEGSELLGYHDRADGAGGSVRSRVDDVEIGLDKDLGGSGFDAAQG